MIIPLDSALPRLHLEPVSSCGPVIQARHRLERVQRGGMKMAKGLQDLLCEDRVKKVDLSSLEKGRLRKTLTPVCQCLKGSHEEDTAFLFTTHGAHREDRGKQVQVCQCKNFFTVRWITRTTPQMWQSSYQWRFVGCAQTGF